MARNHRGAAWISAALLLAACGADSPSRPDATWLKVTEQRSCEALQAAYCPGAFGFTVWSDGHFTTGRSESGAQVGGMLTGPERMQIAGDAALVDASLPGTTECDSAFTVPGVSDRVDLAAPQGLFRVFDLGGVPGNTCYLGGRDRAIRLHDDLAALMSKYYPRPFP